LLIQYQYKKTTGGYFKYPQQREADPVKYTQEATPERIASVLISEQVRKGQLSLPKQDINSYPSSLLARPVRINFPEETIKPSPVQLSFLLTLFLLQRLLLEFV
jgi:hypothetical protein